MLQLCIRRPNGPCLWGAALAAMLAWQAGASSRAHEASPPEASPAGQTTSQTTSPTAGQASSRAATYGLSFKPLVWTVRGNDGADRTIEGVVVHGVALHPTKADSARPIRMLLMPELAPHADGRPAGKLDYDVFVTQAASGRFEGVNLRCGAALVELLPHAASDDPAVRESLDRGRASQSGDGPERHDAMVGFFPRWPMIITHAIVAGSEGTRLIVVSWPEPDGSARAMLGLEEGSSATIDWRANPDAPVRLRARERTCVDVQGDRRRHAAPNGAQERRMADSRRALEAGWKAAFDGGDR